jgi:hypothetical protein
MYSVAYVSTAAKTYSDEELDQILAESRDWNGKVGITGLLLYKGDNFMQFLEGPQEAVLYILGKIRTDSRHHSMIVILQQEQAKREFDSWSMGFTRCDAVKEAPEGFTDLWELPFSSEEFLTDPTRSIRFLLSFKMTAMAR